MSSNRAYTDPFEVLGLPSSASRDEVKRAFRQLALRCHPDVDGSPEAAARFTEVKRAADVILKGGQAGGASSSSSRHARGAWQAHAGDVTAAPRAGWRPRSRHTALWVCAATLAGGFGIFYGAILSHEWLDYTWLSPEQAEQRLRHPTPRRQNLLGLMMQERHQQRQQHQQGQHDQQQKSQQHQGGGGGGG